MKFITLLILASSAFVLGCDNSSNTSSTREIIPLSLGNRWEYTNIYYDSTSTVTSQDTSVLHVTDTLTYNAELLYVINDFFAAVNRSDGYWSDFFSVSNLHLKLKYPAFIGDSFDRDTFIVTNEQTPDPIDRAFGKTVVRSTSRSVTVPAGTFVAYEYERIYYLESNGRPYLREVRFVAPDVGDVKWLWYHCRDDGTMWLSNESLLSKYTVH